MNVQDWQNAIRPSRRDVRRTGRVARITECRNAKRADHETASGRPELAAFYDRLVTLQIGVPTTGTLRHANRSERKLGGLAVLEVTEGVQVPGSNRVRHTAPRRQLLSMHCLEQSFPRQFAGKEPATV